jgi:heme-degrading monooxygenase HmoA
MENQNGSEKIYKLGFWTVRPDHEKEFIGKWTGFAKWTSENFPGADKGYLLQDEKNPLRFISFGPWKDPKAIETWRSSNEFKNFVVVAKELCDDFQPNTLRLVSSSG